MNRFQYAQARSEADVLELLADDPEQTQLLAGGTDLVGLLKKMVITPTRVVNILEVDSMQQIEPLDEGGIAIGAVVHLDTILDHPLLDDYPALTQAVRGINSIQLQAQGTLGGELCRRPRCWYFRNGAGLLAGDGELAAQGDNRWHAIFDNAGPAKFVSASRTAPALIALGGAVRVVGPTAEDARLLPVEQLYRTPTHASQREMCLEPGQFISHIVLPPSAGRCSATYEVRHGSGPDQPLAAAAAALQLSAGAVRSASIVLGQVAATPIVAAATAAWLVGRTVDAETAAAAGRLAVASATPLAHNQYKVQLTAVAVKRALLRATGIAPGGLDEGF